MTAYVLWQIQFTVNLNTWLRRCSSLAKQAKYVTIMLMMSVALLLLAYRYC